MVVVIVFHLRTSFLPWRPLGQWPQHRLPPLRLMSERRQRDRRFEQAGEGGVPRLERPAPEPPQGSALGVVRFVLDHEQGDRERVLEVDGGELSGRRLDEREVAALERLNQR